MPTTTTEYVINAANVDELAERFEHTTSQTMTTTFLVAKKKDIRGMAFAADRAYLSKPVPVQPLYSDVSTRLVYCLDLIRQCTFPVRASDLRGLYQLTNRQRQEAEHRIAAAQLMLRLTQ